MRYDDAMAKKTARKSKPAAKAGTAARTPRTQPPVDDLVGKRIRIERATWDAISLMAREQMKDLSEITEEAFRDLLKKYGRTADFREALKMSARQARKKR
ncbi:MAG: hypothetical protein WC670_11745 [Pseudolabrys sp.]|jgi:hypothetical protein